MVDVSPSENTINITVSQAKSSTLVDTTNNMAKYYEELAETYKNNAKTWCEGTDEEVQALGGTHSAKRYSELTDRQQADWNETDTTAKSYIKNKDTVTNAISELEEDIEELEEDIESKQDTLVSGTNIKSINGNSLLGSGDLELDGLPSQTGNADKFLKTNGTTASWEKIALGTKFAINKGNPSLLVNNSTSLDFNVSSSDTLTYTDINGNSRTVNSLDDIDVSSVADGTYKVVLPNTGNTPTLFNGTIYNQDTTPTSPVANDIWLNPQEPYTCKQYDGTSWNDYSNVLLQDSSVTVASGVITALTQPKYNNSHLLSNKDYIGKYICDLDLGMPTNNYIDLTVGATTSTYTAPANGWFTAKTTLGNYGMVWLVNQSNGLGASEGMYAATVQGCVSVPVKKGDIVKLEYSSVQAWSYFRFVYAKGVE